MKKNNEIPNLGNRGRIAALVLSFVAMITLVGAFTFSQYRNYESEIAEIDQADDQQLSDATPIEILLDDEDDETNTYEEVEKEAEANGSNVIAEDYSGDMGESNLNLQDENTNLDEPIAEDEDDTTTNTETGTITTNASVADQVHFDEDGTMMWPVMGETIMNFSMDQAIYFETLDQYKLNDAMIIAGEVGTEVLACEMAVVERIEEFADTGITVTMNMGNGYTIVYGQLGDVKVTEGSVVEKGQIIGVVAEPTKYYCLEGSNLYLQLLKEGESIDPFLYLE